MRKIKTGNVEIGPDEFNPKKGKFRVNMFVDLDVIDTIRKLAAAAHMPYQTWINRKLRELVESQNERVAITAEDVTRIVDERLQGSMRTRMVVMGPESTTLLSGPRSGASAQPIVFPVYKMKAGGKR